jgi:hypothetical protein
MPWFHLSLDSRSRYSHSSSKSFGSSINMPLAFDGESLERTAQYSADIPEIAVNLRSSDRKWSGLSFNPARRLAKA